MSDLANRIIRQALRREPTAEDYRRVNEIFSVLPDEMRSSPAAMFDIVLRMDFQRRLEETLQNISFEAQQRVHQDLPLRIDKAALQAFNKMRDILPINAADAAGKMYRFTAISVGVAAVLFAICGFILGQRYTEAAFQTTHASSDRELGRCVDAATGALVISNRNGVRTAPISYDTVRNDLMICGAEYADRRSCGG